MINWHNVAKAIDYYQSLGYKYIEVPWFVSKPAIEATYSQNNIKFTCDVGTMVGSAEQSFVQLMLDNKIEAGKYVAASPCYRDDIIDELHSLSFFKVELISIFNKKEILILNYNLIDIVDAAKKFFNILAPDKKIKIVSTKEGIDLEIDGIEVGSYGIRSLKDWIWIYGTGYADPRFSLVIKK